MCEYSLKELKSAYYMRADLFNTVTFGHLKIKFIIVCRTKKHTKKKIR
jgi:hypothetical protein